MRPEGDPRGLADAQRARDELIDHRGDPELVCVGDAKDRRAWDDRTADLEVAGHHQSRHRAVNDRVGETGAGETQLCLGVLELGFGNAVRGLGAVEFRVRDDGGPEHLALPCDVQPRFGEFSLRLTDTGVSHPHGMLVIGRLQASQDLAFSHCVTLIHQHLADLIDHLGAETHHHFRLQGACAEHLCHKRSTLGMDGSHRRRPEQFEQGNRQNGSNDEHRTRQFPPLCKGACDARRGLFDVNAPIHRFACPDPRAPKRIPIEDVLDDDRVPFDRADVLQQGEYLCDPSNAGQLFVHRCSSSSDLPGASPWQSCGTTSRTGTPSIALASSRSTRSFR